MYELGWKSLFTVIFTAFYADFCFDLILKFYQIGEFTKITSFINRKYSKFCNWVRFLSTNLTKISLSSISKCIKLSLHRGAAILPCFLQELESSFLIYFVKILSIFQEWEEFCIFAGEVHSVLYCQIYVINF